MNTRSTILMASTIFLAISAGAQRNFSISATPSGSSSITISWPVQSATPSNDLVVLPQFQVMRSTDLKSWSAMGTEMSGTLHQMLSLTDTNAGGAFYKVQSLIIQEYAQFKNVTLSSGPALERGLFWRKIFGSTLNGASLNGANLGATDLRNATLFDCDFTDASLFYVEASSTLFDGSTMTGVDARFSDFQAASLFGVVLSNADFSSADLTGADLDFAVFNGMNLDTNTLIDPKPALIWTIVNQGAPKANLAFQDLSSALFGANLNGAK